MNASKVKFVTAVLMCAAVGIFLLRQHRSETAMSNENVSLRQELARLEAENEDFSNRLARVRHSQTLSLPAPTMPAVAVTNLEAAEHPLATNLLARIVHGDQVPLLTTNQLKRYLEENHRSAASLLSAYRTSHDPDLLKEAIAKYPGDPQVAFEAAVNLNKVSATPSERRDQLEAFKKAAPDNAIASYLSAREYFQTGQPDQAAQELIAASGRQAFSDYTWQRIQSDEEAYRAAGYSDIEARMAATWEVALPQLADLKALGRNITELAASYRTGGDQASAQAALQIAIGMGQQLDSSSDTAVPYITRLVGIAVQRMALDSMDPSSAYGDGTVQDRIAQLTQRKNDFKELDNLSKPFRDQMTDDEWLTYNQRTMAFGEENAMKWLITRSGKQ